MKYPNILAAVYGTPWAIRPEMLDVICELVRFRAEGGRLTTAEIEANLGAARPHAPAPARKGVAVIPLHGVLAPRMNMMTETSGGTSLEQFGAMVNMAAADPNVTSILLDVDSPGGAVSGTPEAWQVVRDAASQKRVVAIANPMMASAAYWISSAANEIAVTPSGEVGSIGVVAAHQDESSADEKAGVRTTLISAGKRKVWGHPSQPLSEEALEHFQAQVDATYEMFLQAVATGRGVKANDVRKGFGEGGMVMAQDALKLGMVDNIAPMGAVLDRMLQPGRKGATAELPSRDALALRERRLRMLG